jgi:Ca-activated chloride channel homolog
VRLVHWQALLALIPLVVIGFALLRRRVGPQSGRDWAAWTLTGLACLLAVFALSEPRITSSAHGPAVLAVDDSASIDSHEADQERTIVKGAGATNCTAPCRIIRFAGDASASATTVASSTGDRSETDLQSGIAAAIGVAPAGGRVVVLSDGAQTTGDLLADVPLARERHVQVNWVRLKPSDRPDVSITSLNLPSAVHLGDSVPIAVTVHSTVNGFALLKVSSDGSATRGQTIRVLAGDNPLVLLYTAARRGWHSFRATVTQPSDTDSRNNSLSAVTDVQAAPRVLVVTAPGSAGSAVSGMLAKLGMRVRTLAADQLPVDASGYLGEDAVVLDDVPATSLSRSRALTLDAAVSGGGVGMLVLGGPHSFSLGRYATSPLQDVLPVRSLVPGNLQRRNVAIELVLDRSGSMVDKAGGVQKIAMARQAARQTAGFIAKHDDQLGIVDFDIVPHTLIPLERVDAGVLKSVDHTVDGLQANGGTNIFLGLKKGYQELIRSHAQERHIILMTDGITQPENFGPLLTKLRDAHISVATVALGADADRKLLAQIATATGGHQYVTDNAHDLPKVFAKETQLSAKPVRVHGNLSVSLNSDSAVVRSLLGKTLPKVFGNVVVTTKPGAQSDLVASGQKSSTNPALAEWQVGAGRVVTWTPGLGSPWGQGWVAETALWNDAVRWLQRGAQVPALTPIASPGSSGQLEINLAAGSTAALGTTAIVGTLRSSSGERRAIRFVPAGSATYTTQVPGLKPGVYTFELTSSGTSNLSSAGAVAVPYPSEFSPATATVSPMGELVQQTGGRIVDAAKVGTVLGGGHSLEQLLTLLALVCFLTGVAVRLLPGRSRRPGSDARNTSVVARRGRIPAGTAAPDSIKD